MMPSRVGIAAPVVSEEENGMPRTRETAASANILASMLSPSKPKWVESSTVIFPPPAESDEAESLENASRCSSKSGKLPGLRRSPQKSSRQIEFFHPPPQSA